MCLCVSHAFLRANSSFCVHEIHTTSKLHTQQSILTSTVLSTLLYDSQGWTFLLAFLNDSRNLFTTFLPIFCEHRFYRIRSWLSGSRPQGFKSISSQAHPGTTTFPPSLGILRMRPDSGPCSTFAGPTTTGAYAGTDQAFFPHCVQPLRSGHLPVLAGGSAHPPCVSPEARITPTGRYHGRTLLRLSPLRCHLMVSRCLHPRKFGTLAGPPQLVSCTPQ